MKKKEILQRALENNERDLKNLREDLLEIQRRKRILKRGSDYLRKKISALF